MKGIFESRHVNNSASGSKNDIKITKWYIYLNHVSQTCSQIKRRFTCIGQQAPGADTAFQKR